MIKEIKSNEPISVDGILTSIDVIKEEAKAEVINEVITLLYAKIKNKDELTTKERETNTVISLCIEQIGQLKEQNK